MTTSAMQITMPSTMDGTVGGSTAVTNLLNTNIITDQRSSARRHANVNDLNARVKLDDRELWTRFQNLTNEMIVTKSGR